MSILKVLGKLMRLYLKAGRHKWSVVEAENVLTFVFRTATADAPRQRYGRAF